MEVDALPLIRIKRSQSDKVSYRLVVKYNMGNLKNYQNTPVRYCVTPVFLECSIELVGSMRTQSDFHLLNVGNPSKTKLLLFPLLFNEIGWVESERDL